MIAQSPTIDQTLICQTTPAAIDNRLHGHWLWLARIAWFYLLLTSLGLIVANLGNVIPDTRNAWTITQARPFVSQLMSFEHYVTFMAAMKVLVSLAYLVAGMVVFVRRSNDWMAIFVAAMLVQLAPAFGIGQGLDTPVDFVYPIWLRAYAPWAKAHGALFSVSLILLFLYIFPNGRFAHQWSARLVGAVLGLAWLIHIAVWFMPQFQSYALDWTLFLLIAFPTMLVGFGVQIYRYRNLLSGVEQQQVKWVLVGLGVWIGLWLTSLPALFWLDETRDWRALGTTITPFVSALLPITLAIAVLRYRLWAVDRLINRTLAYLALTGLIALLYTLGVGLAGWLSLAQGNLTIPLVAVLAAIGVAIPLQHRLQSIADRLAPLPAPASHNELVTESEQTAPPTAYSPEARIEILNFKLIFALYTLVALAWLFSGLIPGLIKLFPALRGIFSAWRSAELGWLQAFAADMLRASYFSQPTSSLLFQYIFSLINLPLGIALVIRRPGDWVARLLAVGMVGTAAIFNLQSHVVVNANMYVISEGIHQWLHIIAGGAYTLALLLFPHGRLPHLPAITPAFRLIAGLSALLFFVLFAGMYLAGMPVDIGFVLVTVVLASAISTQLPQLRQPGPWRTFGRFFSALLLFWLGGTLTWDGEPTAFVLFFGILAPIVGITGQWLHYLQAENENDRHLCRTVMLALGLGLACTIGIGVIALLVTAPVLDLSHITLARLERATFFAFPLLYTMIPISLWLIVLRYRLWELDLLINRSIVYGTLLTVIGTVYVMSVGLLGVMVQERSNWLLAVLATGLTAILFQPMRQRMQLAVNRLLYGQRDEPVTVLEQLSQRLAQTTTPDAMLSSLVETVAQTLKLPYVALVTIDGETTAASAGNPAEPVENLPLYYQGEVVGQLRLALRRAGEAFALHEVRLLQEIARRAGATVHAAQLSADLQQSRQQLVTAREEERRRLRRQLHDGLGPQLATFSLKIDAARNLLRRDPDQAEQLLNETKNQTQAALSDLRRIVYELRPPALDQLGLLSALQEYAAAVNGLQVVIHASQQLSPLSAAVEVAAYRIVVEAITNVVHHAQATKCRVEIALDEQDPKFLHLSIADNGVGLPANLRAGVGILSMRERAAELGGKFEIQRQQNGGTTIYVVLPVE
jgi:signal transduction histidine kinase